jgi:DNA-binding HxlR family transcriptional regulator
MINSAISQADVRRLSSKRWLIAILAQMSANGGARFSVLERQLSISKSVLSNHVVALHKFGWLARNAGYGHPLRPEYVLTAEGRMMAAWCEHLEKQRRQAGLAQIALGRWSLPILFGLGGEWKRFTVLQRQLAPVTPRALSLALQQLLETDLVDRRAALYGQSLLSHGFTAPLLTVG